MEDFPADKVIIAPSRNRARKIVHFYNKSEVIAFPVSADVAKRLLSWLQDSAAGVYTVEGVYQDESYSVTLLRDSQHTISYYSIPSWLVSDMSAGSDGAQVPMSRAVPAPLPTNQNDTLAKPTLQLPPLIT